MLAFHSSLFLVEGSSDGSAPGDRFLSPGRLCLFTPFLVGDQSLRRCLSWGNGLFFLLWSVSLLSDTVAPFLEETVRSSRRSLSLPVLSMVEFCLTWFLSFPGCSPPGLVGFLPLSGGTAPVWSPGCFWLLGAGGRLASPLWLRAPSFSGVGACGHQSSPCFLT